MKTFSLVSIALSVLVIGVAAAADHKQAPVPPMQPDATGSSSVDVETNAAQKVFRKIGKLTGRWEAPLPGGGTLVDIFRPFAEGTGVLMEEWSGHEQATSTVFYVVGSELRADHYCDLKNQPHWLIKETADPLILEFNFAGATNLDEHPEHFHSAKWHLIDAKHMTQDWHMEGGSEGPKQMVLIFTRKQ
jgi:hypothetical protein